MKNKYIDIYKDKKLLDIFNVGDIIIITNEPILWSSYSGGDCPICSNKIKYPYLTKILKIDYSESYLGSYISFYDGIYGWSLSNIIYENKLDIIKFDRYKKLKNINNYEE